LWFAIGGQEASEIRPCRLREIPRSERIEGVAQKELDRIVGQLLLQTVVLDVEG
jgi:hypothetical protein